MEYYRTIKKNELDFCSGMKRQSHMRKENFYKARKLFIYVINYQLSKKFLNEKYTISFFTDTSLWEYCPVFIRSQQ